MKRISLYSLLFFLLANQLYAQVISQSRRVDWSHAGLIQPVYNPFNEISILSFGGVGDGITSNDNAIQSALQSLNGKSGAIYFPPGNYFFKKSIQMPDSAILRGYSSDSTKLIFNLSNKGHCIQFRGNIDTINVTKVTGNIAKGDSALFVSNASTFSNGEWVKLFQNDSALIFSSWAIHDVGQIMQISKVNATQNQLLFTHKFHRTYKLADNPRLEKITPFTHVGVECLHIIRLDSTDTTKKVANIFFSSVVNGWVTGVESDSGNYSHVTISGSSNIFVDGCYFRSAHAYGGDGQGYGVVMQATSNECLVQDNIFNHLRHSVLVQSGANGNVIGYNYSINAFWIEPPFPNDASGDLVCHGNYAYENLFEGNSAQNIVIDNSHGINGPFNTYFRNRAALYGIVMNSGPASDSQNLAGNEITDNAFLHGLYVTSGNGIFTFGNNVLNTIQPAGTTSLPDTSYYLSSRPAFLQTILSYPCIGEPNAINSGIIPAQARYSASVFTICPPFFVSHLKGLNFKKSIFPAPKF
jgi:hypothetical protein